MTIMAIMALKVAVIKSDPDAAFRRANK
jgi:hypothetical protein